MFSFWKWTFNGCYLELAYWHYYLGIFNYPSHYDFYDWWKGFLYKQKLKKPATGEASNNIRVATIHSLLKLPVRSLHQTDLSSQNLARLQNSLNTDKWIFNAWLCDIWLHWQALQASNRFVSKSACRKIFDLDWWYSSTQLPHVGTIIS